jgi:putative Holliday junction resolvase
MSGTPDAASGSEPVGTVLAFDFGTRKIGVALGNTVTGTARPLTTVRAPAAAARMEAIAGLVAQWGPALLVVGRPLHADASEHEMTSQAARFACELRRRFQLPVVEVDERYTTQMADLERRARGSPRGEDPGRDAFAAQIILQAWLDARQASSSTTLC